GASAWRGHSGKSEGAHRAGAGNEVIAPSYALVTRRRVKLRQTVQSRSGTGRKGALYTRSGKYQPLRAVLGLGKSAEATSLGEPTLGRWCERTKVVPGVRARRRVGSSMASSCRRTPW